MLPFDSCHRFIYVGQDGALQKIFRLAFDNQSAENLFVERLCDGFSFFFRIGEAPESSKESIDRVDHLNLNAHFFKFRLNTCRFALTHEAVVDQISFEAITQSFVSQGGDDTGIDAPGQGVYCHSVPHGVLYVADFIRDELIHIHAAGFDFFDFHVHSSPIMN